MVDIWLSKLLHEDLRPTLEDNSLWADDIALIANIDALVFVSKIHGYS